MEYVIVDFLDEFSLWQAATFWNDVVADNAGKVPVEKLHAVDTLLSALKASVLSKELLTIRKYSAGANVDVFRTVISRACLQAWALKRNARPAFLFPDMRKVGGEPEVQPEVLPEVLPVLPQLVGKKRTHKIRRNSLDVPIDKAIAKAKSHDAAAVYLVLRELALNSEPPFLGMIDGDALIYMNDKNEQAKFTKNALGKRLHLRGERQDAE